MIKKLETKFFTFIRFKINYKENRKELLNTDNFNILSIIEVLKITQISDKFAIFSSGSCNLTINPDIKIQNITFNLKS